MNESGTQSASHRTPKSAATTGASVASRSYPASRSNPGMDVL